MVAGSSLVPPEWSSLWRGPIPRIRVPMTEWARGQDLLVLRSLLRYAGLQVAVQSNTDAEALGTCLHLGQQYRFQDNVLLVQLP